MEKLAALLVVVQGQRPGVLTRKRIGGSRNASEWAYVVGGGLVLFSGFNDMDRLVRRLTTVDAASHAAVMGGVLGSAILDGLTELAAVVGDDVTGMRLWQSGVV